MKSFLTFIIFTLTLTFVSSSLFNGTKVMCSDKYESRECEESHEAEEKHEPIEVENIHSSQALNFNLDSDQRNLNFVDHKQNFKEIHIEIIIPPPELA